MIPSSTKDDKSYLGMIPIILLGLTYSIYVAALWPMVILVVKPSAVGSAYGLTSGGQNLGLAIGPTMVGALTYKNKGADAYYWVNVLLGSFGVLGFFLIIALLFVNARSKTIDLNSNKKLETAIEERVSTDKENETDEDKVDHFKDSARNLIARGSQHI